MPTAIPESRSTTVGLPHARLHVPDQAAYPRAYPLTVSAVHSFAACHLDVQTKGEDDNICRVDLPLHHPYHQFEQLCGPVCSLCLSYLQPHAKVVVPPLC